MKFWFVIMSTLMALSASAIQFDEGLYFNPSASGRGVAVEIQEGVLVSTYFGYNSSGESQWWQGVMTESSEDVYEGGFLEFSGGQCFGCSFTSPNAQPVDSSANGKIEVVNRNTIYFTWPGGSRELLTKQNWVYGKDLDYAYGMWLTSGYLGDLKELVSGSVVFWGEAEDDDGNRLLLGNVSGYVGTTSRIAVATDSGEPDNDGYIYLIVEVEDDFSVASKVQVFENRLVGTSILLDSNSNPIANLSNLSARLLNKYELGIDGNLKSGTINTINGKSTHVGLSDADVVVFKRLGVQLNLLNELK